MSEIPQQPEVTEEDWFARLQTWYLENAQKKKLASHEHMERVALAEHYFSNPNEGTNRLDIGLGYDLKLVHSYNYKVDEGEIDNVTADEIKQLALPWDDLFVYKPSLNVKVFRALNAEQTKFVQKLLTITDGSPQLDIVPRADTAGQQAHVAAAEAAKPADHPDQAEFDKLYVVSLKAKDTEAGQYHFADDTWWLLGDDMEWIEVPLDACDAQDRNIGVILHKQLERAEAAKPKRGRGRPKTQEAK